MAEQAEPQLPREIIADVASGIKRICVETGRFSFGSPNFYLISSMGSAIIFDSGLGSKLELSAFEKAWSRSGAPRIEAIVVSHDHSDHADGVERLAGLTHAAGVYGARFADLPEEFVVGDRRISVVKTPGHTDDSVCLLLDSHALFTADTVIGDPSVIVEGSMSQYFESLRTLRGLGASVILPGHGDPIRSPEAKIRAYLARREEREEQILGWVKRGLGTPRAIARELYPTNIGMGTDQIERHLEKLADEGKVLELADGRFAEANHQDHPSIIFPIAREAAYAAYLHISMLPRDAGRMMRLIDQNLGRGRSQQLWGWVKETIQNAPEEHRDEFAVMFTMGVLSVEKALLEQSGGLPLPTIVHKDTEEVFHLITGEAINYLAGEQVFEENSAGDEVDLSFLEIMRPLRDGMTTDEFSSFVLGIAVALGLYIKADDRARGKPSDFRSFPILDVFGISTRK